VGGTGAVMQSLLIEIGRRRFNTDKSIEIIWS